MFCMQMFNLVRFVGVLCPCTQTTRSVKLPFNGGVSRPCLVLVNHQMMNVDVTLTWVAGTASKAETCSCAVPPF